MSGIRQAYLRNRGIDTSEGFGLVTPLQFGTGNMSLEATKTTELTGKFIIQAGSVSAPSIAAFENETTGTHFEENGTEIVHDISGVEVSRLTADKERKKVHMELLSNKEMRLYDADESTPKYLAIKAPANLTNNLTITWPSSYGTAGQQLITDGAGGFTYGTASVPAVAIESLTLGETITIYDVIGIDETSQKVIKSVNEYDWSIAPTNTNHAKTTGVLIDGNGNIIVVGIYKGTLTFSGASAITSGGSGTRYSMFVCRIDPTTHDADWVISIDNVIEGQNIGNVVSTDDTNIWVAGTFGSDNDLIIPDISDLSTSGTSSIFVIKLSSATGTVTSAIKAESVSGTATNVITGIVINGGVGYICGYMSSNITFASSITATGTQLFISKFASDLSSWTWTEIPDGGTGYSIATGIVLDGSNQPIICGYFLGNLTLTGPGTISSLGSYDIFVAQVDVDGTWQWASRGGGIGDCRATCLTINGTSVYVGGTFTSSLTLPSISGTIPAIGKRDGFIAKITTSGVWTWSLHCGGNDATVDGISYSSNGIHICGLYNDKLNAGSLPKLLSTTAKTTYNGFVGKVATDGTWRWTTKSNNDTMKTNGAISSDATGVICGGTFRSAISFGLENSLTSVSSYKNVAIYRVNNRIYEVGIALESGVLDDAKNVFIYGLANIVMSLLPGQNYYNNNGRLSQTTGSTLIGRALTSDKFLLQINFENI